MQTSYKVASTPTLVCGPDANPMVAREFELVANLNKQSSRIQNLVPENDHNLWTELAADLRNAPTKVAKKRDVYNDLMSRQIYEEDVDSYIAKFRGSTMNASLEPTDTTALDISIRGLLASILNQETERETLDKCTIVTRKELKRINMVRASLSQNDTQKVGGKTMEQWRHTPQLPNQSQSSRIVGQNCSRDSDVMDVNSARITITDEEMQRHQTRVRCSVCFGCGYVYSSPFPTPKSTHGGQDGGLTTVRTENVKTHDQNEECSNENDDSCPRVAKIELSPKNEPEEVAKNAPKSEDVATNQICAPL